MKYISKKGFTLTELMTVVIILGILVSIAAGSYRKAAERSNFSEGLVAAHSIMEAVKRYHIDHPEVTRPQIAELDLTLSHQKNGGDSYSVKTKYFTVSVKDDGHVEAVRTGGKYTISVYPETFGSNRLQPDTCKGKSAKTDFCVSVGYTACNTTTGICTKP